MPRVAIVGTGLAPLHEASGALERAVLSWADALTTDAADWTVRLVDEPDWLEPPGLLAGLGAWRPDLVVFNNRPLWSRDWSGKVLHVLHNYPDAWELGTAPASEVAVELERGAVAVSPTLARDVEVAYGVCSGVGDVRVEVGGFLGGEVSYDPDPSLVLFPNRLLEKKGVRLFLETCAVLAAGGVRARPVMFAHLAPWRAPTPEHVRLFRAVEEQPEVELLAPPASRLDMARWYGRAAVVVCPSMQPEGLGMVALEAQGIGAPLVTSGLGGLADATFPPNEVVADLDPESWAAAVVRAMTRGPVSGPDVEVGHRYSSEASRRSFLAAVKGVLERA